MADTSLTPSVADATSLTPPRVWFWFVPAPDGSATNIRKWSHAPFDGGVEYRPAESLTRESAS